MKEKVFLNPINRDCRHCKAKFEITPAQQQKFAERDLPYPTHCPECRLKKHQVEYTPCKDCGEQFPFNQLEREYYEKKGYVQPVRCLACRKARREAGKR